MKVYGPYINKQGRKLVIIKNGNKSKTTQYARYLLEQHLGRSLSSNETVDHIDNDFTNDDISNLQILSRADNARKSSRKAEIWRFLCPVCQQKFEILARRVRDNNKRQGKSGPYCSKSCAGKVHGFQNKV